MVLHSIVDTAQTVPFDKSLFLATTTAEKDVKVEKCVAAFHTKTGSGFAADRLDKFNRSQNIKRFIQKRRDSGETTVLRYRRFVYSRKVEQRQFNIVKTPVSSHVRFQKYLKNKCTCQTATLLETLS